MALHKPSSRYYLNHKHKSAWYVVWKDKKAFAKDMKQIYDATTKQAAKAALEYFSTQWKHKYP